MSRSTDKNFLKAAKCFITEAAFEFDMLWSTWSEGADTSFDSEICQRAWYHLGLCLPETDPWFLESFKKFGEILPPKKMERWGCAWLWGSLEIPGGFFQRDVQLPEARLRELLGTGLEPAAYTVGTLRTGLEIADLRERTANGEKFKEQYAFTWDEPQYLSSETRSELKGLTLDPIDLHSPMQCLYHLDSLKFDLLVAEDNPFVAHIDPPIDDSQVPAGDDASSRPTLDAKPSTDGPTDSLVVELERLKALVDEGFLTEEQAEQAKRRLLDD